MPNAVEIARLTRRFYLFVKAAWPVIETSDFVDSWHLEELSDHCEAISRRKIRRLACAIPPGMTKSRIFSVLWPAWHWTWDPGHRWMFAMQDLTLAKALANLSKELVQSSWYQARWGHRCKIAKSETRADGAQEYYIAGTDRDGKSVLGYRFTTSIGSKGTGWHVQTQVTDDPIKPSEAHSAAVTAFARNWWKVTMASRTGDHATFARVILQQRVCGQDLIGLGKDDGYEQLILPMEYDPDRYNLPDNDARALRRNKLWNPTSHTGGDRRTKKGELLCPSRFPASLLPAIKKEFGPAYGPQCNQDTTQDGERPYPRSAFKMWRKLPPGGTFTWDWDFNFKSSDQRKSKKGSFVVGWCWYETPTDSYLVREERSNEWGCDESEAAVARTLDGANKGPTHFEAKANGPAIESALKKRYPGIALIEPQGSKLDRARAVRPYLGTVHLPDTPLREEILSELENFPGEPNDRGDVLSQHLRRRWLGTGEDSKDEYKKSLANLGRNRRGRFRR